MRPANANHAVNLLTLQRLAHVRALRSGTASAVVVASPATITRQRGNRMPKYLLEVNYTQPGVEALLAKGGTVRKNAANAAIKSLGGKMEAFYFAFGSTDAYVIADMPDEASAAAMALTVSASGAVTVNTHVLLTPADIDAASEKNVSYRPPGR